MSPPMVIAIGNLAILFLLKMLVSAVLVIRSLFAIMEKRIILIVFSVL